VQETPQPEKVNEEPATNDDFDLNFDDIKF
jgi:hypothetical protein